MLFRSHGQERSQHDGLSPIALAAAEKKHAQHDHLGEERDHASARAGKKNTSGHERGDCGRSNLVFDVGELSAASTSGKGRSISIRPA